MRFVSLAKKILNHKKKEQAHCIKKGGGGVENAALKYQIESLNILS